MTNITAARVDIATATNVTWQDAFQFDPPPIPGLPTPPYNNGATGPAWTLTGQNFVMDIKGNVQGTGPALTLDSGPTGSVMFIVDDANNRILHSNVPDTVLTGLTGATGATGPGLIPGRYIYNFVMYDASNPSIRIMLMEGKFHLEQGV